MTDSKLGDYFTVITPDGEAKYLRGDMSAGDFIKKRQKAIKEGVFMEDGQASKDKESAGEYLEMERDGAPIRVYRGDSSLDDWKKTVDRARERDGYKGLYLGGKQQDEEATLPDDADTIKGKNARDEEEMKSVTDARKEGKLYGKQLDAPIPKHLIKEWGQEEHPLKATDVPLVKDASDAVDWVKSKFKSKPEEAAPGPELGPVQEFPEPTPDMSGLSMESGASPTGGGPAPQRAPTQSPIPEGLTPEASRGTGGVPGLAGNALNLPQMAMGAVPDGGAPDAGSVPSGIGPNPGVANPGLAASLPTGITGPDNSATGPNGPNGIGDPANVAMQGGDPGEGEASQYTGGAAPQLPQGQSPLGAPASVRPAASAAATMPSGFGMPFPKGPQLTPMVSGEHNPNEGTYLEGANMKAGAILDMGNAEVEKVTATSLAQKGVNSLLSLHDGLEMIAQQHRLEREQRGVQAYQNIASKMSALDPTNFGAAHYWSEKSTGQKVASVFAGFLFGLAGKGIDYLKSIQTDIDQDIESQKAKYDSYGKQLGAQTNLYAQYRQLGLDEKEAGLASRASILDAGARYVQSIAQNSSAPEAKARALAALGELQMQTSENIDKLHTASVARAHMENASIEADNANRLKDSALAAKKWFAAAKSQLTGPGKPLPPAQAEKIARLDGAIQAGEKELADVAAGNNVSGFFKRQWDSVQDLLPDSLLKKLGSSVPARKNASAETAVEVRSQLHNGQQLRGRSYEDAKAGAVGVGVNQPNQAITLRRDIETLKNIREDLKKDMSGYNIPNTDAPPAPKSKVDEDFSPDASDGEE